MWRRLAADVAAAGALPLVADVVAVASVQPVDLVVAAVAAAVVAAAAAAAADLKVTDY